MNKINYRPPCPYSTRIHILIADSPYSVKLYIFMFELKLSLFARKFIFEFHARRLTPHDLLDKYIGDCKLSRKN